MTSTATIYYQGGAMFVGPQTKTQLRKLIKERPATVHLYDTTAPVLGGAKWEGPADELPTGVVFNVVGPDPFTKRDWYASVYKGKRGQLIIK
jgi:hypothetical protein